MQTLLTRPDITQILTPHLSTHCTLLARCSRALHTTYGEEALNWHDAWLYAKAIRNKADGPFSIVVHELVVVVASMVVEDTTDTMTEDRPMIEDNKTLHDKLESKLHLSPTQAAASVAAFLGRHRCFQVAVEFSCDSGCVKHTSRYRMYASTEFRKEIDRRKKQNINCINYHDEKVYLFNFNQQKD